MGPIAFADPPLSDGVVTLRPHRPADAPRLVEICQDPEIPRWTLVPSPYGEADARAFLRSSDEDRSAGRRAVLAITEDDADGRLVGNAGLQAIDWRLRAADVGYLLAADARGRGLATRAVGLICGWAFDGLGLERLELRVQTANAASLAVARRAGFEPVAEPLVRRPECDHLPDAFFARVRA